MDLAKYCVNAALVQGRSVRAVAASTGRSKSVVHRHVALHRTGGEVALVLHGQMGKKARAEVTLTRPATHQGGLALAATASLLGEGFDCPPLDTLFLAFPIKFKGERRQYVECFARPPIRQASRFTTTSTCRFRSLPVCTTTDVPPMRHWASRCRNEVGPSCNPDRPLPADQFVRPCCNTCRGVGPEPQFRTTVQMPAKEEVTAMAKNAVTAFRSPFGDEHVDDLPALIKGPVDVPPRAG